VTAPKCGKSKSSNGRANLGFEATPWAAVAKVADPLSQLVGEHYEKSMANPRAVLREELQKFPAHAEAMEKRWGTRCYRRFTPKMRQFATDIPVKLYKAHD
jgi:hypothetical protein